MQTDKKERFLLIAYPYGGIGANMLRYKSFVEYLCWRGHTVDVIGYYENNCELPHGCNYYRIRPFFSFRLFLTFFILMIHNLYLLSVQSLKDYIRRVGLAAITYTMAYNLIKRNEYKSCLVGILPWSYYLMIPKLRRHIKTVVDISDPLYKNAVNVNSDNKANFRLEKKALEDADAIITMNEPTISIMTDEFGIPFQKISFISPSMNIGHYSVGSMAYKRGNGIRLIYSGSLYAGYRDLDEFIPAIESVGDLSLDIYTNSRYRPSDSDIIKVHDAVSHNDILKLYQQFDILLFVDNFYGYQVPSKIFELIAQNKPILFVYDKRNQYLYNKLKNQKGIYFVENNSSNIKDRLNYIKTLNVFNINYTFDLLPYSEMNINKRILSAIN